jgi:hypothetical protein
MLSDLTHFGSLHQPLAAPLAMADKGSARPESWPRGAFDGSQRAWCELIRDVVAVANSGGGRLAVPMKKTADETTVLNPAALEDRLFYFAGATRSDLPIEVESSANRASATIVIPAAAVPILFSRSGTISDTSSGAKHEVYPAGSLYFRHGDVSEPGTLDDMRAFFRRVMRRAAGQWLSRIRRVLRDAASFPEKQVGAPGVSGPPQPVRIVTDPAAPALQPQDVDRLYPLRQKDLVRQLNREFGRRLVNSYDVQAVRRQHHLDERPDFVFHLPGAGRRYSRAAAEWIVGAYRRDPEFFQQARAADHETMLLRRRKPR